MGIENEVELAKEEERITKLKAIDLFESGKLENIEVGTFKGLAEIHKFLFEDIYDFAGKLREENIAKGNYKFASRMYLEDVISKIDKMSQSNFEKIIEKYVEMNVAIHLEKETGEAQEYGLTKF